MALYIGLDCGWERFRYEVQNGRGRTLEAGWREWSPAALVARRRVRRCSVDNVAVRRATERRSISIISSKAPGACS